MAGELPFGLAPSGELTAYTPTLRERVSDWLRPMLFSDDRAGQEKANRLTNWAETMIPPFGFATQMYDTGRAGGEGDYLTAGLLGAMAFVPGGSKKGIRAYHGSPHSFDKFSMDKIGTGEGAQAYGHGLYFAENEDIARSYRDALAPKRVAVDGKVVETPVIAAARKYSPDADSYIKALTIKRDRLLKDKAENTEDPELGGLMSDLYDVEIKQTEKALSELEPFKGKWWETKPDGSMYEVNIDADPNAFLDWDKPLSEQPEAVRNAYNRTLKKSLVTRVIGDNENFGPLTDVSVPGGGSLGVFTKEQLPDVLENPAKYAPLKGGELYNSLVEDHHLKVNPPTPFLQSRATATEKLKKAGIPGIKYLDAGSRGAGDGTRNFVVFDDNLISIVRKYGIAGASAMLGYNLLENVNPAQADELKRIEAGK